MRGAAPLGAHLDHAAILPGGSYHGGAFRDIHAGRFLHIDIGPGFGGFDHGQGVPMVRGGNQNHVEILFLQHLPVVFVKAGDFFGELAGGGEFAGGLQHLAIDIAEGNHVHRGRLDQTHQVRFPIPTSADEANAFFHGSEFICKGRAS